MIEVKNLQKNYGSHTAVSDLSFTVEEGQVYGFLGPNGAGKTTTMNIICGYIGATSGDVLIDGFSISEQPVEAKRRIGYLPEQPPLYLDMTTGEYLRFAAEIKEIDKGSVDDEIEKAMTITGLGSVRNRLLKNLSKGYRQRVGLAQAIIGLPPVIILDEPMVGLDPKQIIEMRDLIRELGKNHTVILSSHILSEISAVCDKCLIISNGRLVACDTPSRLEDMMNSMSELNLTVRGTKSKATAVLKNIETEKVVFSENPSKGCCEITVYTNGKTDIRDELFFAFAKAELPIIAMNRAKATLEDVFLDLTSETPQTEEEENDESDN